MKALKAVGWGALWFVVGITVLVAGLLALALGAGFHMNFEQEPWVVLLIAAGIFGMLVFGYEDDEDTRVHRYVAAALFAVGFLGGPDVAWIVVQVLYVALVLAVVTSPMWGAWLLYRRRRHRLLH